MDDKFKSIVIDINNLLTHLENFSDKDLEELQKSDSSTLSLRDTKNFNFKVSVFNRKDVQQLRRSLARDISAEKWRDGAIAAFNILRLVGGL